MNLAPIKIKNVIGKISVDCLFSNKNTDHFDQIVCDDFDYSSSHTEAGTFVNTSEHFLVNLVSKITFNKDYTKLVKDKKSMKVDDLGIGDATIWHGIPDARIHGFERYSEILVIAEESQTDELPGGESQGDSIEAKTHVTTRQLPQLVATAIVSSFTERNAHLDLNPAVPSILLSEDHAYTCIYIYDCIKDLLFISTLLTFLNVDGTVNTDGAFVLWLAINHR